MKNTLFLSAAIILSTSLVHAQMAKKVEEKKNAQADSTVAKTLKTKDLTVTALRQPEYNLEVPMAVTIIPRAQFLDRRGFGLDEVMSAVPGVLVQSRSGSQDIRLTIRGFGARGAGERSNAGTSRGIRVLVDGIPETEPDGRTPFDMIDPAAIQSMEIIRSNGSALFGNASGGVVSISTVPTTNKSFVNLSSNIGSYGLMKNTLQAGTTSSLGKFYFSMGSTKFDGWRQNSGSEANQFSGGFVTSSEARTKLGVHILAGSSIFRIPGPLNLEQFNADPSMSADTSTFNPTFIERQERRNNRMGRLGLTIDHKLDDNFSITGMTYLQSKFLQRSERNTFRDFNRYHFGGNAVLHHVARINSDISSKFLAGADYQYQDGAILFYSLKNGQRGDVLRTSKREGAANLGLFFQEEIMLGDNLSIIAGGRFDKITYYTENYVDGAQPVYKGEEKDFERFTPKAGITYKLNDGMAVYANLGGGVEVPAGNETDPPASLSSFVINPLLAPIQSTSLELGFKTDNEYESWLGLGRAKVTGDIALYTISTTNDIVPYSGGRFYFSAGETTRRGVELGHTAQWDNGLTLQLSLTASDNTYDIYRQDSLVEGNATGAKYRDFSGNAMAGIPNLFGTLRLRFEPRILAGFYVEAEARHVGKYFADDGNALTVSSYTLFDAGLGYKVDISEQLSARLYGRLLNVTDQKYASGVWINPDTPKFASPAYLESGLPRNYMAGITLSWTGL
jgi:iron complex outermembrane receptor protein